MSKEKSRYFKCSKCGEAIREVRYPSKTDIDNMGMCTRPVTYRTSGICGGGFTLELTEEEYNKQLENWEEKRNKNNK